jgi:hypothetical protein
VTGPFDTYAVASVDAVDGTVSINGYGVPVDPMDDLQCESCQ